MFNPNTPPAWVSGAGSNDGSVRKFHRAVKALRDDKLDITEDAVLELYVKYGGLVLGEGEQPVDEEVEALKKGKK
jgi:hypothetical protein